jgi:hypothetical protein
MHPAGDQDWIVIASDPFGTTCISISSILPIHRAVQGRHHAGGGDADKRAHNRP